ncbi:MAG: hypothetical protein Kow00122_10330 [Thermoleophilia bacterium]
MIKSVAADLVAHAGLSLRVLTASDDLERSARVREEARAYLAAFDFPTEYRVRAGEPVRAVAHHAHAGAAGALMSR